MTDHLPIPQIGIVAYRAMHSVFLDTLMSYREEIRRDIVTVMNGANFDRFLLALTDPDNHVLRIRVKPEGDEAWLGVDARIDEDWTPFMEVNSIALGVSAAIIFKEQQMRLEDALADILGEGTP